MMKSLVFKILFVSFFSIFQNTAAIDPTIQNQIKQKIQSLEQKQADILKTMQKASKSIDPVKQKQQIADKMNQPCGDFCKWKNEDFITLEVIYENDQKDVVLHNVETQLQSIFIKIESEINELINFLKSNGFTSNQLAHLQKNFESVKSNNLEIKQSMIKCKDKVLQINSLKNNKRELEDQYSTHKDLNSKQKLNSIYTSLEEFTKQWIEQSSIISLGYFYMHKEMEDVLRNVREIMK